MSHTLNINLRGGTLWNRTELNPIFLPGWVQVTFPGWYHERWNEAAYIVVPRKDHERSWRSFNVANRKWPFQEAEVLSDSEYWSVRPIGSSGCHGFLHPCLFKSPLQLQLIRFYCVPPFPTFPRAWLHHIVLRSTFFLFLTNSSCFSADKNRGRVSEWGCVKSLRSNWTRKEIPAQMELQTPTFFKITPPCACWPLASLNISAD